MEPVLDEHTLIKCETFSARDRIRSLAKVVALLDGIGAKRVIRTVSDFSTRLIEGNRALSQWCFDRSVDSDSRRLVAARLDKRPYIDGEDGLFHVYEKTSAIEPTCDGRAAPGLGYSHLCNGIAIGLLSSEFESPCMRTLTLLYVDNEKDWTVTSNLSLMITEADVAAQKVQLIQRVNEGLSSGKLIIERSREFLPCLRFGPTALDQLQNMSGTEKFFPHVIRHLREFQEASIRWAPGTSYQPRSLSDSIESDQTLNHARYGPMRDFPTPQGFEARRWSRHSKIGANTYRMYFDSEVVDSELIVLIGYIGPHLQTVDYQN